MYYAVKLANNSKVNNTMLGKNWPIHVCKLGNINAINKEEEKDWLVFSEEEFEDLVKTNYEEYKNKLKLKRNSTHCPWCLKHWALRVKGLIYGIFRL